MRGRRKKKEGKSRNEGERTAILSSRKNDGRRKRGTKEATKENKIKLQIV